MNEAERLERDRASLQLNELLQSEGITARAVYRPLEVCRLLRMSPNTFRHFCELAEHPAIVNPDPRALDSFRVGGHHRVPHSALVDWLIRNQSFNRNHSL